MQCTIEKDKEASWLGEKEEEREKETETYDRRKRRERKREMIEGERE